VQVHPAGQPYRVALREPPRLGDLVSVTAVLESRAVGQPRGEATQPDVVRVGFGGEPVVGHACCGASGGTGAAYRAQGRSLHLAAPVGERGEADHTAAVDPVALDLDRHVAPAGRRAPESVDVLHAAPGCVADLGHEPRTRALDVSEAGPSGAVAPEF